MQSRILDIEAIIDLSNKGYLSTDYLKKPESIYGIGIYSDDKELGLVAFFTDCGMEEGSVSAIGIYMINEAVLDESESVCFEMVCDCLRDVDISVIVHDADDLGCTQGIKNLPMENLGFVAEGKMNKLMLYSKGSFQGDMANTLYRSISKTEYEMASLPIYDERVVYFIKRTGLSIGPESFLAGQYVFAIKDYEVVAAVSMKYTQDLNLRSDLVYVDSSIENGYRLIPLMIASMVHDSMDKEYNFKNILVVIKRDEMADAITKVFAKPDRVGQTCRYIKKL